MRNRSTKEQQKTKMGRSQKTVILRFDNGPQTHDVFIFWCVTCLIGRKKQYKIKRNGAREEEKLVEVSKERKEESSACRKHIKAVSQLCCKDQKNASAETIRKKTSEEFNHRLLIIVNLSHLLQVSHSFYYFPCKQFWASDVQLPNHVAFCFYFVF